MQTNEAVNYFLKSRLAKRLSPESIRWYRDILGKFAESYHDLPETPEPIYDFISSLTAGDERVHGYYRALRAFYKFLDKQKVAASPMPYVEAPRRRAKKPRPLTIEELQQLLSFPHKAKIKAALMFLTDTGCRVGELANLQVTDITETPWGHMARVSGKTGGRLVPISLETYHVLSKVLPLGYSTYRLRRLIRFAFDDAHVRGSSISLRHSFGTYWEGDELILQNIMGHTHLETTKIYRQLRTRRMIEQHQKYSPLKMLTGISKGIEL